MIKEMPNIKELLSGLRQEISDLQSMNARYAGKRVHSEVEQTALELRTTRLREISRNCRKCSTVPRTQKSGGKNPVDQAAWRSQNKEAS